MPERAAASGVAGAGGRGACEFLAAGSGIAPREQQLPGADIRPPRGVVGEGPFLTSAEVGWHGVPRLGERRAEGQCVPDDAAGIAIVWPRRPADDVALSRCRADCLVQGAASSAFSRLLPAVRAQRT